MIDDPPTLLRFRVPGRPGRIWLCDVRNWGFEPQHDFASASEEASWIADVMRKMVDHLARHKWGGLKATVASQALYTWRRQFMTHNCVAHADAEVLELEEAGYHGGRCEAGRLGRVTGPLYYVDRRSAYAHACAETETPLRVVRRCDGTSVEDLRLAGVGSRCLAEVYLEGDEPAYPVPHGPRVRYPVGRRRSTLAGPELDDALRQGCVRRVGRCVEYECAPALRAFARAAWACRAGAAAQGSEIEAWLKRLLVCLPGKLGQRAGVWKHIPDYRPTEPWSMWWGIDYRTRTRFRMRALSGVTHMQERSGWTYDALPAVAAWITSAARVALLDSIRVCGWENCVYWDTDSLLLTCQGWDRLQARPDLVGDGLGQWRLIRPVSQAHIYGIKHYDHDGAVTCAGRPKQDVEATRLADHYWYRQTFGQALSERHAPVAGRRLRRFDRPASYDLGRVGDGGRVYPFVHKDW